MPPLGVDEITLPARATRPWCLFRCGQTGYAIGLESVAEVVEVERLVRLPHCPPRVLGLCALRRELIPVIGLNEPGTDPASTPAPAPAGALVLILRTARGTWAVRINSEGTIVAEEGLDEPAPAAAWLLGTAFLGTVRRDGSSYAVIDTESTWLSVRQSVEEWYCDGMGRDAAAQVPSVPAPEPEPEPAMTG